MTPKEKRELAVEYAERVVGRLPFGAREGAVIEIADHYLAGMQMGIAIERNENERRKDPA